MAVDPIGQQKAAVDSPAVRVGLRVMVSDLEASTRFYRDGLGLPVTHQSKTVVTLEKFLALVQARTLPLARQETAVGAAVDVTFFLEASDAESLRRRLTERGTHVSPMLQEVNRQYFTCSDPDGHPVEVFDRRGTPRVRGD